MKDNKILPIIFCLFLSPCIKGSEGEDSTVTKPSRGTSDLSMSLQAEPSILLLKTTDGGNRGRIEDAAGGSSSSSNANFNKSEFEEKVRKYWGEFYDDEGANVHLHVRYEDEREFLNCGSGFIIQPGFILTAAHVVFNPSRGKIKEMYFHRPDEKEKNPCEVVFYSEKYRNKCIEYYRRNAIESKADYAMATKRDSRWLDLIPEDYALLHYEEKAGKEKANAQEPVAWYHQIKERGDLNEQGSLHPIFQDYHNQSQLLTPCVYVSACAFDVDECRLRTSTTPYFSFDCFSSVRYLQFEGISIRPGMSGGSISPSLKVSSVRTETKEEGTWCWLFHPVGIISHAEVEVHDEGESGRIEFGGILSLNAKELGKYVDEVAKRWLKKEVKSVRSRAWGCLLTEPKITDINGYINRVKVPERLNFPGAQKDL